MRSLFAIFCLVAVFASPVYAEGPQDPTTPQVRPLASDEFDRYLTALDAVMTIRSSAEQEFLADPAKGRDQALAAGYMKRANTAMESNGFTNESFNTVHWNVMQAFAQLEIQANTDDVKAALEQQREELAATKDKMPAKKFAVVSKRLDHTEAMLEGMGGIPDANIALVQKNMASLKATFERARGGQKSGGANEPKTSKQ